MTAKIREVGVHSLVYGFGSVAQSAVQFLLIPILTATLATAQFGAYSLIQMASVIAGAIFYLGMTSALPRSYFDYSGDDDRRSVFTTAFILLVAGALAQVALGLLAGGWISTLLLGNASYRVETFWAFFGSALSFVNYFFFSYLRFLRRSIASIVLSLLALVGSLGISVYLLRLDPSDLSAPFKGVAYAQALVAIAFVMFYGADAFTFSINRKEIPILLKFGIPTVVTSVAAMAIDWADRILIARMLSVDDVGIYSVGFRLGSIVNALVIVPFSQIWNPMMIEYRSHANIDDFFSRMVSYYFLVTSLILVTTCFFVRDALPLIARSAEYAAAAPVILLVMAGYLLNGSSNILGAGVIYERRILRFAAIYYAIAVLKLILNIFLIRYFGILGAATTTLLIYALMPVLVYWQAARYFRIRFEVDRLLRILVIVTCCLFFGLFVDAQFDVSLLVRVSLYLAAVGALAVLCTKQGEKRQIMRLIAKDA